MKRARLIYNPSAGREEVKRNIADILETLESIGYEASAFATKGKDDAMNEAKRASAEKFDLIVSAGGDGTLYEVINGISNQPHRPKLGILPFGTSNDFANALGIPKNLAGALEVIKKHDVKKVDVGKVDEHYFINVAGGGRLTELTYEVPSKLKTVLGQLAYYIKGIEKIAEFKPYKMEFEANGKKWKEEVMLFLVSNSNVMGGFDKIAPLASLNDGVFDVLILKKCNLAELARLLTLVIKGEHINDSKLIYFQTDKFKVKTKEDIQINVDGELGGTAPCTFEILNEHIEVIVNN